MSTAATIHRFRVAEHVLKQIQGDGGRLNVLDGKLFCGPREVATQYAADITEYKPELLELLSEPSAQPLSAIQINQHRPGTLGWYLSENGWTSVDGEGEYPLWQQGNGNPMEASAAWAMTLDEMKDRPERQQRPRRDLGLER